MSAEIGQITAVIAAGELARLNLSIELFAGLKPWW
jgi:hypothetical protein